MASITINETSSIVINEIYKYIKKMKKGSKRITRYNKFDEIRKINKIEYSDIETYINKQLKNKYDKTTKLYLEKVVEQFMDYIKITIAYKKFRDGLEKLLNVNYKEGIKTLELIDTIDKDDYEDTYDIDDLYEENKIYKVSTQMSEYKVVPKETKNSIVCYSCVCGWCIGPGLQYLCIFRSDLFEGHFILGYVCNDNTEKYIELEQDPIIKSILNKLDIIIKSKHSDINKKRCMNIECVDKDKRTVIKGREQELKFLKGNFCSKCIKDKYNKGKPITRECLKDDCKNTYNYWKKWESKPYCLECRRKYFKK